MNDVQWLTEEQRAAWLAYLEGCQLLERAIDHQLRTDGDLAHSEYEILARLSDAPDRRLRMGALADRLVSPKSRLSYQIDRLVRRRLVRREPHPGDGRGTWAVLTDEGMALLEKTAPGHVAAVRDNLIDVLDDDALRKLGEIMGLVAARIRARDN